MASEIDRGYAQTGFEIVEAGDELTIAASGEVDGEFVAYKDNRTVHSVSSNGDLRFADPTHDMARVIRPDSLTVFELGDDPEEPLTNPLEVMKVWVWSDRSSSTDRRPYTDGDAHE
jgi:hypothetical protein